MWHEIKKPAKILLIIILFPLIISIASFLIKFDMQLGRIIGTIIRMIMSL